MYAVVLEDNSLQSWSTRRLPFEPSGWLNDYRDELREALRALAPEAGRHFRAVYASPDRDFADVENVLLYNVGAGSYRHLTDFGVEVLRVKSGDGLHHMSYTCAEEVSVSITAGQTLASVTLDVMPVRPDKAGSWWAAMRPRVVTTGVRVKADQLFTIEISLNGSTASFVSLIKPMLDGLISALHVHDHTNRDHIQNALAQYGDADELWAALNTSDSALLGQRSLVRPHRDGIAWNPADDLCGAFLIAPTGHGPKVSTTIRRAVG